MVETDVQRPTYNRDCVTFLEGSVLITPENPLFKDTLRTYHNQLSNAPQDHGNLDILARRNAVNSFLKQEVDIRCLSCNDSLLRNIDIKSWEKEIIGIGEWRYVPEKGIYVRAGWGKIALSNHKEGAAYRGIWTYEWKPYSKKEGAFNFEKSDTDLEDLNRIYNIARRFTEVLEGYLQIEKAKL